MCNRRERPSAVQRACLSFGATRGRESRKAISACPEANLPFAPGRWEYLYAASVIATRHRPRTVSRRFLLCPCAHSLGPDGFSTFPVLGDGVLNFRAAASKILRSVARWSPPGEPGIADRCVGVRSLTLASAGPSPMPLGMSERSDSRPRRWDSNTRRPAKAGPELAPAGHTPAPPER